MVHTLKLSLAAAAAYVSFSHAAASEAFLAAAPSEEPVKDTSAAALCPGSKALEGIVEIAPECFRNCPHICGPMDEDMIIWYTNQDHPKARFMIKKEYCEDQDIWDCMFEEANKAECSKLLTAGNQLGTDPPMTRDDLESRCEGFNGTAIGDSEESGPAHDVDPSAEETNGSPATAVRSLLLAVATAAAVGSFRP